MSTVVISGGIVATVILLCIVTVLCYCRLQRHCCECDVSDSDARPRVRRDVNRDCGAPGTLALLPFDPSASLSYCPTCSAYRLHDNLGNVNAWPAVIDAEPREGVTAIGSAAMMNVYTNTHAISTDV